MEIFFVDSLKGWGAGYEIIYITDGGRNWERQYAPIDSNIVLWKVSFVDSLYGWAVGCVDSEHGWEDGVIIHTTDGGENWYRQNPYISVNLWGIDFVKYKGWVVGDSGTILYTSDGGENWVKQNSRTLNHLGSVDAVDSVNVWVCGGGGTILHTTSGGGQ